MTKFCRILPVFVTLLLLSGALLAQSGTDTTPQRPKSYTVQPGDTLWDIAERFLFAPWLWKEVWHSNPAIENPDLIYPGDIVYLSEIKGKLNLKLMRGTRVKLSPHLRSSPISVAIPAIPIDAIHQFLTRPFVITGEIEKQPYIVAFPEQRLIAAANSQLYALGIEATKDPSQQPQAYNIVRAGEEYRDSKSGEVLGREAIWVGEARLEKIGSPSTLMIKEAKLEVMTGDRLYPVAEEPSIQAFYPKPPKGNVDGGIISELGGGGQIGQYSVVALDRGSEDGLEVGDVLQIDALGGSVRNKVDGSIWSEVKLPNQKAATLMIFRTFSRVSFALVMSTTRALHVGDRVRSPERKKR